MDTLIALKETSLNPVSKTDFLLFDKVAVPNLSYDLTKAPAEQRAELEYLLEKGLLLNVANEEIRTSVARDDSPTLVLSVLAGALTDPRALKSHPQVCCCRSSLSSCAFTSNVLSRTLRHS